MLLFVNGLRVFEPEVVLELPHAQAGFPAAAFYVAARAFKVDHRERNSFCHDLLLKCNDIVSRNIGKDIIDLSVRKIIKLQV